MLRSSIFENLLLPNWMKYGFPLKISKAVKAASETAKSMNVVMSDVNMSVSNLSGGNAQKIVLGKWMQRNPKLFLLNDPTKGVDVGTKGEFYALLKGLRDQGAAIIFFSSDDEELVSLCDRILVMYNGKLRKELSGTDLTLSTLVATSLDTTSEY
jgi:ribose transport system ATP-binding protein